MSRVIAQTEIFKATPRQVYEALMDSDKHSEFTNSAARISREVGGEFMAYDGYITGKNLELVPDQKIVQSWRAEDWPENQFSIIEFLFSPLPEGTQLQFTHSNLPDGTEDEFTRGWIENYWEPLRVFLEK